MTRRLSVNIGHDTAAVLHAARDRGRTATDTIRRAVAVYRFLADAARRGDRIQLVDQNGRVEQVTLL